MVDDHKGHPGPAKTRQALVLGKGEREVRALVDDVDRGPDRGHRVEADLRGRPREGIEQANLDLLLRVR